MTVDSGAPGPVGPVAPESFRVLVLAELDAALLLEFGRSLFGPFAVVQPASADTPRGDSSWGGFDAVVVDAATRALLDSASSARAAVVAVEDGSAPLDALGWLAQGAQDVVERAALTGQVLARQTRFAIERQRIGQASRRAHSTDTATGLPHREQFVEHMSHLLALREREPSPMAVLALRIEGLASAAGRFGTDVADVLRRRLAVRLRAGVRASDIVASIGSENFAVLLGSLLAPADAGRVAAKLVESLLKTFSVGGHDLTVAVALGVAAYPQDGADPERLLRKALAFAAAAPAEGRAGFSNFHELAVTRGAANDE